MTSSLMTRSANFFRSHSQARCFAPQAWTLPTSRVVDIWSIEPDDLALARSSITRHPELSTRDLLHLACCRRRRAGRVPFPDRCDPPVPASPIPPRAFRRNRSSYDSHHRTAFCSSYHSDRARTVCPRVWSRGCRHCRTRESPHLSVAIHFRGS